MDESRWDGLGRGRFWSNTCCFRWYFLLCLSFVILIPYCLSALVDHWINAQFPFHFSPFPVVEILDIKETSTILFSNIGSTSFVIIFISQSEKDRARVETVGVNHISTIKKILSSFVHLRPPKAKSVTTAAAHGEDSLSTTSVSSHVSLFGLNQCPRIEPLRAMKDELTIEMERCRQLFDAVIANAEGTNNYEDAALESDSARHGLCDLVFDYKAFARQMVVNSMPGNPLRFAASSLPNPARMDCDAVFWPQELPRGITIQWQRRWCDK